MEIVREFTSVYGLTVLVFCLSAICVGVLVELFKQSVFTKLEEKYKEENKDASKLKTVKGMAASFLAVILVGFFLACIYASELPTIGGKAVVPIWFTIMYLLQLFVDIKALKNFLGKLLGNIATAPKDKPKKKKKVVTYVDVDEE